MLWKAGTVAATCRWGLALWLFRRLRESTAADTVLARISLAADRDIVSGRRQRFDIARELEQVALNDDYFKARNLYPNVDFYSGVIFLSMGIPVSMFTVMFALSRTIGWISQWNEMMGDEESRIGRPRQLYMGAERRDYVPMNER